VYEALAFKVAERLAELVGVQDEHCHVQAELVRLQIGPHLLETKKFPRFPFSFTKKHSLTLLTAK